jgi:hypothetical protein
MRSAFTALVVSSVAMAAVPAVAHPCTTMALVEWQRRGGNPALNLGIGDRPTDERATFHSATHPIRVHASAPVSDALAQQVLAYVDAAWEAQVVGAGFPAPLPDGTEGGDDRFDVYVVALPQGLGGVTVAEADPDPADGRQASPSFMQLDPSLGDDLLEVYAHHEFQHALQFALDTKESLMWSEASAVFWEVRARPDVTDWHLALPDFQSQPQAPLFGTGATVEPIATRSVPRYEYGAVLFALYLDEVRGDGQGTLLRQIWERTPQPDDSADNEPDFIDAMIGAGVGPDVVLADFAGWRALVGPFAVDDDGPIEDVPAQAVLASQVVGPASLDGSLRTSTAQDGPFPLGCWVRAVTAPANVDVMPVVVHAEGTLEGQVIGLSTVVLAPDATSAPRQVVPAGTGADVAVDVPGSATLQVAVCDVGAADPDEGFDARPVALSMLRTDVEFPDAGPEPQDAGPDDAGDDAGPPADEPSCMCQSTTERTAPTSNAGDPRRMRAGLGVLGTLVGLFAFGVRGARHVRRKRLYRPPSDDRADR